MPASFGARLRWWRTHRSLSQLDLAGAAGTTQRHVSFLESGRTQPSRDMVLRLAAALDVPLRQQNALLLAAGYAPIWGKATSLPPHWRRSIAPSTICWPSRSRFPPSSLTGAGISYEPTRGRNG